MKFEPDFSKHPDGLVAVVAQDVASGDVLMVAWMNEAAWKETLASGRATYWSRSRKALWRKGDMSGHVQKVEEIRTDCDGDAVLLRVEQTGAACHEGYRSCFFRTVEVDGSLRLRAERIA